MINVLIYSSKELYDKSSYEGRAEAHVIAYRDDDDYIVLKNRTSQPLGYRVFRLRMKHLLECAERDEWQKEFESYELKEKLEKEYETKTQSA
jgi:hypothetical protein